jgi:glucose-1-phosphate thymidylyltransferase
MNHMSAHGINVILLAAGYGTRLYPLTKDCPKALLPLGTRVVLDVIVDALTGVPGVRRLALVTNHRFMKQLQAWQSRASIPLGLIDDGTLTPETRLGAIRDLRLGLDWVGLDRDVLVLGTDNLFTWSLADFAAFAHTKRPASTVALRQVRSAEEARRCAVVEVDAEALLVHCVEKPDPERLPPRSSFWVALCVYYFPAPCLGRVDEFLRSGGSVDAPGYFIEWLVEHDRVYGFVTQGTWLDIGSQTAYRQAVQRWARLKPQEV